MARVSFLTTVLPMALGVGFYWVGKDIGHQGDLARVMGRADDAISYHLAAAMVTAAGAACFLFAVVMAIKNLVSGPRPARASVVEPLPAGAPDPAAAGTSDVAPPVSTAAPARVIGAKAPESEAPFDPDAIIQRYLANREQPPAVPPQAFGRKRA